MRSMLRVFAAVAVAVAVVLAVAGGGVRAAPVVPTISSTFTSGIISQAVSWGLAPPTQVVGFMASDSVAQRTLIVANESAVDVFALQLYKSATQPQGVQYTYLTADQTCQPSPLTDEYFPWFAWLSNPNTAYMGQAVLQEQQCEFWALNVTTAQGQGMLLALYTTTTGAPQPVRLVTADSAKGLTNIIDFYDFTPTQPPAADFNIPPYCVTADADVDADADADGDAGADADATARVRALHRATSAAMRSIGACTALNL